MNKKYIKYMTKYINLKYDGGMISEDIDYSDLEKYLDLDDLIKLEKQEYDDFIANINIIKNKLNNRETDIIKLLKTPEIIMEILIIYNSIQNKKIYDVIIDKFVNIENISINYIYVSRSTILFNLLLRINLYDQIKKYNLSIFYSKNEIINFYRIIFYPQYINNFKELIRLNLLPIEFISDPNNEIYKILNYNFDEKLYKKKKYVYDFNIIHFYNDEEIMKYFLDNFIKYKNLVLINILLYNETFELFNKLIHEYSIDINNIEIEKLKLNQIIFIINNIDILEYLKSIGLIEINFIEPFAIIEYYEEIIDTPKKFIIHSILELDKNIYHGSYHKIDNYQLNVPTFYSLDILQSLGHILIPVQSYFHYFKHNHYIRLLGNKNHTIYKPLNYYPVIYIYKIRETESINLLLLDDVWNDDFSHIYIPKILYKYVIIHPDFVNIIYKFCSQIMDIYRDPIIYEIFNKLKIIIGSKDLTNDIEIDYIVKYYLNQNLLTILERYAKKCAKECFRSFLNISGYELLTKIDYNAYFNEIGIKDPENIIDGFYVPNDQDEIILLNNNKIEIRDILYIVPYSYLKENDEQIIKYITEYLRLKSLIKKSYSKDNPFLNFYGHYLKLGKNLDDLTNLLTLENSWFFDYYSTYCNNFNPYTHEIDSGCDEICKMLIPTDRFVYKDLTNTELVWSYKNCGSIKSQKVSIYDTSKLSQLEEYITLLLLKTRSSILFGNIEYLE